MVEIIKGFGPWITIAIVIVGYVFKIKREFVYKVQKEMGKEQLLLALTIIKEIYDFVPVEELLKFLLSFKERYTLEKEMKESVITLSNLLSVKKSIIDIHKPRKKTEMVAIKNKKFFAKLRRDKDVEDALENMANLINAQLKLQSEITKQKVKPTIDQINKILENAKENLPANREKRINSDKAKQEANFKTDDKNKTEIGKKLHEQFKKK